ncbi:hypothetical protein EV421DRAFT_1734767 [Armillaria borealis]|uniref:Uncharacterized protein n=1 Tax=Armillaria borealis TaxID=47425 RepID=A0AA39MTL6_9AGAR|nr:hypothetical protein EV421DRAFT_1734767 [Armillaria borealis]
MLRRTNTSIVWEYGEMVQSRWCQKKMGAMAIRRACLGRYASLDPCCQPEGENRMVRGATTRRTDPLGDVKSTAPERKSDGIRLPMSKEERGICVCMLSFVSQCLYDWTFCDSWSRNVTFIRDGTSNRFTKTSALGVLRRVYHGRPLTPELPIRRVDIEPVIRVRVTARDISLDSMKLKAHILDISRTLSRRAMVNDHGYIVDMRVNTVSACTVVGLEGCEHGEDMVKMLAHITSREEARTEVEGIVSVLDALSSGVKMPSLSKISRTKVQEMK